MLPKHVHVGPRGPLLRRSSVLLDPDGSVHYGDQIIGRVEKSTRTYSPPTHRGSRIARYHKQVPCWRLGGTARHATFDTRLDALAFLVAHYGGGS
jgi:hypothetical protein